MNATDRFTVLITGLSLLFAVMVTLLTLIWKAAHNAGVLTEQVKNLVEDVKDITIQTNERLTYLERK
jgi:hypothetical protein